MKQYYDTPENGAGGNCPSSIADEIARVTLVVESMTGQRLSVPVLDRPAASNGSNGNGYAHVADKSTERNGNGNGKRHVVENLSVPARVLQVNSDGAFVNTDRPGETAVDKHGTLLLDLWPILRRHKLALVAATILGGIVGLLFTLPQTPTYQARATIEIQALNDDFLNMKQIDPTALTSSMSSESYVHTQVKILQSRALIGRVIDKLNLQNNPEFAPKPSRLAALRAALGMRGAKPMDAKEHAITTAANHLQVRISGQTRIAEILYDSIDPKLAANFANVLANEFILQNLEAHWKTTQNTGEFLTTQLKDLKSNLEKSDDKLQAYARATGLMFTAEKDSVAEKRLEQVQEELSVAQGDRAAKQSQYELANTAAPDTLPDLLNDLTLREYQVRLTDLRRQLAELSAVLTPSHTKVERVQAEIQELEQAVQRQKANLVTRIRNNYQASVTREKLLASEFANQTRVVADQTEKAIHYNILKRDVETNRQLYEAILQRMKEAGVSAAMRASNMRVVDQATPPARSYKPDFLAAIGVGMFMGLSFGIGGVLVHERVDRSLQQPGDVSYHVGIPELGVIPSAKAEISRRSAYGSRPSHADAEAAVVSNGSGHKPGSVELVTWRQKASLLAEAFHATLTSILLTGKDGQRPRVVLFTSPGAGEGKTTVLCNLGIALAEVRQRVLLIDADMRRPRLHTVFGLDNEIGFSDLLQQPVTDHRLLQPLIKQTAVAGLSVLCSGPAVTGTHNLLHSAHAPELMRQIRAQFDTVLIDTPPMLHISDARVLAGLADAVVLVVRSGKTTRDAALAARKRFAEDNTPVMGAVLNDWDPQTSASYSGYGSSGYERYYAATDPGKENS